ncbi:uncharacterized protein AKAME5_002533300 [Lates japonicus]|uniref:Uncharacterized protein n=1 Tax=Lates japonicus TaxID=270547 RepID=A0AAD3NJD9_LATJO|nr:uncharacterized protein AKAME5_002533300 [Lates japonicus]
MHAGSGEVGPIHLPPLPLKVVSQQQVKKLSKRSSASSLRLDSQHPQLDRCGFEEQKLPMIPGVVKQDNANKEGIQLRRDRLMPLHLLPDENTTQASSSGAWSAGRKPETPALRPNTELNSMCKLPEIKSAQAKRSRPRSGDRHGPPNVLAPISEGTEELGKKLKLPPIANKQRAESPTMDKAKKKKKVM